MEDIFILVFAQIVAFIGMALILRKILISSSYKETNRLQQLNEENAQKAKDLARKIADAENEYRVKMSEADDEVRDIRSRVRKEAEELKEAILAKGKAESDHIISQALNSKKEIRAEIESEMWDKSVSFASMLFVEVLGSDEQMLVFNGFLDNILKELNDLDNEQLKSIDMGSKNTAVVKTSHSIDAKQKEKLESILSTKMGQDIKIEEVMDKELISGIVIMLNSFVIDGSLSGKFKQAADKLR